MSSRDLTDEEWREFQNIPEQGYSHRAWVNARIAERVEKALAEQRKEPVQVCMYCNEPRHLHEHYSGACQARGSGNTRYSERSGWNS